MVDTVQTSYTTPDSLKPRTRRRQQTLRDDDAGDEDDDDDEPDDQPADNDTGDSAETTTSILFDGKEGVPEPDKFPCLVYIVQLAIRALFEHLKLAPMNDTEQKVLDDKKARQRLEKLKVAMRRSKEEAVAVVLYKVSLM